MCQSKNVEEVCFSIIGGNLNPKIPQKDIIVSPLIQSDKYTDTKFVSYVMHCSHVKNDFQDFWITSETSRLLTTSFQTNAQISTQETILLHKNQWVCNVIVFKPERKAINLNLTYWTKNPSPKY